MKKEKLLPLFKHYMITSFTNESYIMYNTPLECQIISAIPNFVVSDGFHKVPCLLTKEAMIKMKENYPTVMIRSLKNYIITLDEYGPHTILDKHIHPILHIYKFTLRSLELQDYHTIIGKPKEIVGGQDMKHIMNFETTKHMKNSLLNKISPDNVPPLEPALIHNKLLRSLGQVITYEGKKAIRDNAGKITYSSETLERMEDSLIEAASRRLAIQKDKRRRQKEQARRVARQLKEKPKSLSKDLIAWENDSKIKKGESSNEIIKEGVAKVIARENANLSTDKTANSSCGTVEKSNIAEMKFNANEFKNFIKWKSNAPNHDSESNNVKELLEKEESEIIRLSFIASSKSPKKAFDEWITSAPPGKREFSEGANSSKKSSGKKLKL